MAGLFFCFASAEVQDFYFTLLQYSPIQAFAAVFMQSMQLYRPRHKTAHIALRGLFLRFAPFNRHRYQTDTSGYNTICATLEHAHAPGRPPAHTRYHRHAGTLYRSAQTAYYNKVYKGSGAPLLWIHARRCSRSQTMPARRFEVWHPPPGGAVQRRAARNHWWLSPHLFSGFRPIANRGQQ